MATNITNNEIIDLTRPINDDKLADNDNIHRVTEDTVICVDEHPRTYEDLNNQLVNLFECPICFEHIFPPIFQCLVGHLICCKCILQCEHCPTCRNAFNSKRNIYMEKVGLLIQFPCTNLLYGCKELLTMHQKETHELQCYFLPYQCFFINCQWKGNYPEMTKHMINIHSHRILKGSDQSFEILLKKNLTACNWLLLDHGEQFAITFHSNRYLQIQVNLIGPVKKAEQFKYSVTLTKPVRQKHVLEKLKYETPILPYTQINEISYHDGLIKNVFFLPYEVIEPYTRKKCERKKNSHCLSIVLKVYPVPMS